MTAAAFDLAPTQDVIFQAVTAGGAVQIFVPAGMKSVDALDQALLLARCEGLIAQLERWLGLPLDPTPAPANVPRVAGAVAFPQSAELGPVGVRVRLPWSLLLNAAAPPRELLTCAWPSLLCEVGLARYDRAPGSREALRQGQLLLPGAFQPRWQVRLADSVLGLELGAICSTDCGGLGHFQGARLLLPHPDSVVDTWRVVLAEPVVIPLPLVLGWEVAALAWPTALARLLGPGDPPVWAEGQVVPAWNGAALVASAAI